VVVSCDGQVELCEDAADVRLDRLRTQEQRVADRRIGPSLRHEREDLLLPAREFLEASIRFTFLDELSHDLGIDGGPAGGDALYGGNEAF
jgi:hypothetical protein